MTPADHAKLVGVHPQLIAAVDRIFDAMECLGFQMLVTDGLRTAAQQHDLWLKGRGKPGPIVTHCDGIKTLSNHQAKADGLGHAVDCAFMVGKVPSWDARLPWRAYGAAGEALGLKWGGSFERLVDLPHLELP